MTNALVVDDTSENQTIICRALDKQKIEHACASSTSEAVELATSRAFDFILMDLNIPIKPFGDPLPFQGLEAAAKIFELVGDKPIIAVTAGRSESTKDRVFAAGLRGIVEKGPDFERRLTEALQGFVPDVTLRPAEISSDSNYIANVCSATHDQPEPSNVSQQAEGARNVSDSSVKSVEPVNIRELRQLAGRSIRAAARLMDELKTLPNTNEQLVDEFVQLTNEVGTQLLDESVGPMPGECYDHWMVNLMHRANAVAEQIIREVSPDEHAGKLAEQIENCLVEYFRITNCRVAGQCVESIKPPIENDRQACRPDEEEDKTQRSILIVDDEPHARTDLEAKIKRLNYRVVTCESSITALDLLKMHRFDICLLDLNMPEMSGLEMIQQIRRSGASCKTSIIVVSGAREKRRAAEAIEHGADDYLEKPANEHVLQARIRSCLRNTDARISELRQFLPPHVLDQVLDNKDLLEKPVPADVSVMFCDIRGFSRISEQIGPIQTIRWISDVMNTLSTIVLDCGGTIIDYVGDEIMAMWGAPVASPSHAEDACRCALRIQDTAAELSRKWLAVIGEDMEVGVGINSGIAVVGNTGSKQRIKFGPLGDMVNVASRIQGATRYLHSPILVTRDTANRIKSSLLGRRLCQIKVRNINEPIDVFELAGDVADRSGDERYEEALADFETGKLDDSFEKLNGLLLSYPQDGPAKLLMLRVIESQLGGSYQPIWELPGK